MILKNREKYTCVNADRHSSVKGKKYTFMCLAVVCTCECMYP